MSRSRFSGYALPPTTMVSPPKPWERAGAGPVASSSPLPSTSTTTPAAPTSMSSASSTTAGAAPTVPDRPETFSLPSSSASPYNRLGTNTYSSLGTYGSSPYGASSYGGLGSYGGYGSTFGGGYGGYNSYGMGGMYSSPMGMGMGMGGMYNSPYGMNSPYGGMGGMGMPGQPGQPPSLTQTLESTTHQTFALIHSIVQTFGGVAQMLESTFMATHSSFFAMVGVVDQFTMLRNALGSVLGVFGLLRWLKETIIGRPSYNGEFKDFVNGRPVLPTGGAGGAGAPGTPGQPKINKKPLVLFLLALFGVPYLMAKFIRLIAARQQEALLAQGGSNNPLGPLDPSQLTFARALYPFTPSPSNPHELGLKENEIVAIMGKLDPRTGGEVDPRVDLSEVGGGEWWRGRTRDGREGWFPRKWVEVIQGKQEAKKVD